MFGKTDEKSRLKGKKLNGLLQEPKSIQFTNIPLEKIAVSSHLALTRTTTRT